MSKNVSDTRERNLKPTNRAQKGTQHARKFFTKFNNDWVMSSAAGLAYNLILAIIPIAIALISVLGFTLGRLQPDSERQLREHIQHIFPSALSASNVLQPALTSLSRHAGFLGFIAILTAIFGGSRLFIAIEGYFDIIYRTPSRKVTAQNVMAFLMLLVYIVLTPLMIFAASVPAVLLALVQSSVLREFPGMAQLIQNGIVLSIAGVLGSLIVSWILFEAIYLVVPNQRIGFEKSWPGAVVAAILLQLFLFLFPLYIAHFMGSYTGEAGFLVIFLLFFYYFAVILLLGAEINAYFAEGVQPLPENVAAMIRKAAQIHKKPEATAPPGRSGQRSK